MAKTNYKKNHLKIKETKKKYRDENREAYSLVRKKHLLKKLYGLSLEAYKMMSNAQDNKCAICLKENKSGRKLSVDHSHKTGDIRGLLCGKCNLILGQFDDDIELLERMIGYLKRFS